jgi:hypothetical protein
MRTVKKITNFPSFCFASPAPSSDGGRLTPLPQRRSGQCRKNWDSDHDRRTECAPSQSTAAASSAKVDNSPRDVEASSGIIAASAACQISLNSDCCSERSEPQATLRTNERPPDEEKPIVPDDRTTKPGHHAALRTTASGDNIRRGRILYVAGCSIRFSTYFRGSFSGGPGRRYRLHSSALRQ